MKRLLLASALLVACDCSSTAGSPEPGRADESSSGAERAAEPDSPPASEGSSEESPPASEDTARASDDTASAQTPEQAPADPPAVAGERRVFYIGHSLQGFVLPRLVEVFAEGGGGRMRWETAMGIGANLGWHWTHPDSAMGENPRTALAARTYDVLVMTEAIPLRDQIQWSDSSGFAGRFYDLALARNPACQAYVYETWHERRGPQWRRRLDDDLPVWESLADAISAAHEGPDVLVIPGGQAMAALHDAIAARRVPGVRSLDEFFTDEIHPNDRGWYFLGLVHYATLFRRSPIGATTTPLDMYGTPIGVPPAEAIPVLQQIAWDVVRRYRRSGVGAQ